LSAAPIAGEKGNFSKQRSGVNLDINFIEKDGARFEIIKAVTRVSLTEKNLSGRESAFTGMVDKASRNAPP